MSGRRAAVAVELRQANAKRWSAQAATASYSPPLWSTAEYGTAHGGWEGEHHRVRTQLGWEVWASRWAPVQIMAWEEGLAKAVIARADASTDPKLVLRRILETDPFASEREVRVLPLKTEALKKEIASAEQHSDAVRQMYDGDQLEPGKAPALGLPATHTSHAGDGAENARGAQKIQRRAAPGERRLRQTTARERLARAERVLEPEDAQKLRNRQRAAAERSLSTRSAQEKARHEQQKRQARRQLAMSSASASTVTALSGSDEENAERFLTASHNRITALSRALDEASPIVGMDATLAQIIAAMDTELAQCKVQWQRASNCRDTLIGTKRQESKQTVFVKSATLGVEIVTSVAKKDIVTKVVHHAEKIMRRKQSLEQQLDRVQQHEFDMRASVTDPAASDNAREQRLMKKLKQIDDLIADHANGVKLSNSQQAEISHRPQIEQELDSLLTKQYRPRPSVMVTVEQFVRRLSTVHPIEHEQARALFLKYGHDEHGRMPILLFCTSLFTSDAHLRSIEGVHRGAFGGDKIMQGRQPGTVPGSRVNARSTWQWHGALIRAPHFCRTGFFAPSHWEHTAELTCRNSLQKPSAELELEHIYGRTLSEDVFVTRQGLVAYFAAGVAIVYNPKKREQRFFRAHTDDITCMCIHRAQRKAFGTKQEMRDQELQMETQEMIATGQCATLERATPDDDPERERAEAIQSLMKTLAGIDQLLAQQQTGRSLTAAQEAKVRRRPKLQLELESHLDKAEDPRRITEKATSANAGQAGDSPSTAQVRQAWKDLVDKPEPVNRVGKLAASKRKRTLLPPVVYIWNPQTLGAPQFRNNSSGTGAGHGTRAPGTPAKPVRLQLPADERAVACLAFSADGEKLLTISADNNHTARLWNWRRDAEAVQNKEFFDTQCQARTIVGAPSMVFGCAWNPFKGESGANKSSFITWGKKHLNVWEYNEEVAFLRVPPSDQNPVDISCPGAISCDGVPLQSVDDATGQFQQLDSEPGRFRVRVIGVNNLNVLRIDRGATGWGTTLLFRVKVKPRIVEPGRSPRLAMTENTNEMSKDVLTAAYLRSGHIVSGGPNGCITVYDGVKKEFLRDSPANVQGSKGGIVGSGVRRSYKAVSEHQAHRRARKAVHGEGHFVHGAVGWKDGGCSCLRVHPDYDDQLLSGGGDGTIRHWQIEFLPDRSDKWWTGKRVKLMPLRSIDLRSVDKVGPPRQVLSVDWITNVKDDEDDQEIQMHKMYCMVADGENDIWMIPQKRKEAEDDDEETDDEKPQLILEGQSGDVYAIAAHPTCSRYFATACEDGHVYLWDSEERKVLRPPIPIKRKESELRGHRPSDLSRRPSRWQAGEVLKGRSCAFSPDGRLLAVGSSGVCYAADGSRIWEKMDRDNADRGGVLTLFELPDSLFETRTDTGVHPELEPEPEPEMATQPDALTKDLIIFQLKISSEAIAVIRFSPDGRLLAVGGHDNCIRIFDVQVADGAIVHLRARCKIEKHSSTVTHLDWSRTPVAVDPSAAASRKAYVLQSTSASYELLYFDSDGQQVQASMRDTAFATWSVPLGFPVMGMWRNGMDGSDINSCDTCHTSAGVLYGGEQWVTNKNDPKSLLAFADDRGDVNLMTWPAVVKEAPCRRAAGHSSHVMAVRWATDNQRLFSAGGKDQTTFQWKVLGVPKRPLPPTDRAPTASNGAAQSATGFEGHEEIQNRAAVTTAPETVASQPVSAAVLRAQKVASDQRELMVARCSIAEVNARRKHRAGQSLAFTVNIMEAPVNVTTPTDTPGRADVRGSDARTMPAPGLESAVALANKQLTVGMILHGNPVPQFNGKYRRLTQEELHEYAPAAAMAAHGEGGEFQWPVLRNATGRLCYRHVGSEQWVLSTRYTPWHPPLSTEVPACNSAILAVAGTLPAGTQIWQCWQAPLPKQAISKVLKSSDPTHTRGTTWDMRDAIDAPEGMAVEYQVAFVKDYAAIEARGDQFTLSADGPVGWLRLEELMQRAGGREALRLFEKQQAKKSARHAQLKVTALRKEEKRLSRKMEDLQRKYGNQGEAEETEAQFLERKQREAEEEWATRQRERQRLEHQQLKLSQDVELAAGEAELHELRASAKMLQRCVSSLQSSGPKTSEKRA